VVDVLSLLVVVLDAVVYMLKSDVEDLECTLDGVQLRQGEQLDLWRTLMRWRLRTTERRTSSRATANTSRLYNHHAHSLSNLTISRIHTIQILKSAKKRARLNGLKYPDIRATAHTAAVLVRCGLSVYRNRRDVRYSNDRTKRRCLQSHRQCHSRVNSVTRGVLCIQQMKMLRDVYGGGLA